MNKYVDQLKLFIGGKASEFNGLVDEEFFNGFLSEYRPQLNLLFELLIWPPLDEETLKQYFETARREYQSMHPIDIKPGSSLKKSKANTWLDQKKQNSISWDYTQRHLDFLYKSGKPKSVIEETEKSSLSILRNLENPEILKPFFIKGLVVGSVQSGKTANFNAVINRGIDVGYKLIIVLSGIMEDLRSQTQLRIENDVVGNGVIDLTSNAKGAKGVGKITRFGNQGDQSIAQVNLITSHTSDFNRALADANFSLDFTNILICKKNTSVLRNLIVWLYEYLEDDKQKHEIPLLIIDDEADNASLNNLGAKGREYASKINGHIRTLLALFDKKVYLGYTATPFANVLQDRNDEPTTKWPIKYRLRNQQEEIRLDQVDNLFPDDFISLLSPPSNYIGPTNFFETILSDNPKIPLIEIVPEEETIAEFPSRVMETSTGVKGVKNFINKESFEKSFDICDFPTYNDYRSQTKGAKAEHDFPKKLPNSLKIAVDCFVLSIALRDSRKSMMIHSSLDNPHNTMLVHISRFTKWQNKTRDLIAQYMNELRVRLENETPNDAGSIYKHLESVWHGHYSYIVENISTYLPSGYTDPFLSPKVFDVVKSFLINAISDIEVKAINNVTKHKLSYENQKPQKVIAVGGNRLSRGFTLEGLTINYFVRNTNYSDTSDGTLVWLSARLFRLL